MTSPWKDKLKHLVRRFKKLQGDPHYIALGMAIGVFVSITPTIPFHTVIALALAFVLKASKPAAAIAVWFSNPLTIPLFYYGSFKTGSILLDKPIPFSERFESMQEMLKLGIDVTIAAVVGGIILGIIPGLVTYAITYRIVKALRLKALAKKSLST